MAGLLEHDIASVWRCWRRCGDFAEGRIVMESASDQRYYPKASAPINLWT
jgi:hypothetical protein